MFRTEVQLSPSDHKITTDSHILSIGSCFAQVIGNRLSANKFNVLSNPFGTLFNPASICRLLTDALQGQEPDDKTYLQRDGMHFNYLLHSDFASPTQQALSSQIQEALASTSQFLQSTDWLIITLGTSFYYQKKDSGEIVANCHKMPAAYFEKKIFSPKEISAHLQLLIKKLVDIRPALRIMFTVSPVRHIRDTLEQNTLSKASLRLGIHEILSTFPENTLYFPSYEIMMDDLRDYRFYKADMIHPSEVAEDYIWDKWRQTYMNREALDFIKEWDKIKKALAHRSFHPTSEKHQQFIMKTIERLQRLSKQVDVSKEISELKQQLI